MSEIRLLLCTDMDRTVIPNGFQPEHPEARRIFHNLCNHKGVRLTYVTGRHLQLVKEAIEEYNLPTPRYVISDVGTKIYEKTDGEYTELSVWQQEIARGWRGKSHSELQQLLAATKGLNLQEPGKQNDFKLSYYLPMEADFQTIVRDVETKLQEHGVAASLIASVDEPAGVGLLDVLPRNATKLHGLNFLGQYLGFTGEETLFAGDSGNDLPVLESAIRSILVANADPELKKLAASLAEKNGNSKAFFQAENEHFPLGGNYSAGVIQGVIHYMPEFEHLLDITQ